MSKRRYHYPLSEIYSTSIHTPAGVFSLIEQSHMMDLLRELQNDGHDVSAAAVELAALVNYVTSTQISLSDLSSHLDYCAEQIIKLTR